MVTAVTLGRHMVRENTQYSNRHLHGAGDSLTYQDTAVVGLASDTGPQSPPAFSIQRKLYRSQQTPHSKYSKESSLKDTD